MHIVFATKKPGDYAIGGVITVCHVCKRVFEGDALNHIALKHRERALRELANTLG